VTVTANAPGSGTIALSGNGTAAQADVALTITDDREFVQIGETLNYVITVSNASGPQTATVMVSDILPAELTDGAWTCVPTGAATCADGTGDTLSDSASLPAGTSAIYVYSATVLAAGSGDLIANSASAAVTGGAVDPNPANNTASDTPADVVVVFRDGFDTAAQTIDALDRFSDGAGFISAQLLVNASLLDGLGIMPVAVASGETAGGATTFTIELARFNAQYVMRLLVRDTQGPTVRSEWRAADLAAGVLDFAWQSASAGKQDGYLHLAAGTASVQSVGRSNTEHLVRLHIAVRDDLPWLSVAPD